MTLVADYKFNELTGTTLTDHSGNNHHGTLVGDVVRGVPGLGKVGMLFGQSSTLSYVRIPSHADFSIGSTGMTIEAVIAPSTMSFSGTQAPLCPGFPAANYISFANKCGDGNDCEWAMRMYPDTAVGGTGCTNRAGRISGYVFNLAGDLGSGSYNQPSSPRVSGTYITVRVAYDAPSIPNARVHLWLNGAKSRPSPADLYSAYNITPQSSNADLILGAGLMDALHVQFRGAFDSFKVWRGVVAP